AAAGPPGGDGRQDQRGHGGLPGGDGDGADPADGAALRGCGPGLLQRHRARPLQWPGGRGFLGADGGVPQGDAGLTGGRPSSPITVPSSSAQTVAVAPAWAVTSVSTTLSVRPA